MIDKKLKEEWWDILNSNLLDRPLHMVMHTQEELFYEFLDRAYALGKVKEAITQEEIEKAAEKFATDVEEESVSVYPEEQRADIYPEYETSDLINAFEAGANFTLGKQTDTITNEEVEKATEEYAAEVDKNVRELYGIENLPISLTFGECAAESFREGVKYALGKQEKDAERSKEKLMCLRDRTKVCNRCHACDIDTDAWHSMYSR